MNYEIIILLRNIYKMYKKMRVYNNILYNIFDMV